MTDERKAADNHTSKVSEHTINACRTFTVIDYDIR